MHFRVSPLKRQKIHHKASKINLTDVNSFMHRHCLVSSYATLKKCTQNRLHMLCCSGPFKSGSSSDKTVWTGNSVDISVRHIVMFLFCFCYEVDEGSGFTERKRRMYKIKKRDANFS